VESNNKKKKGKKKKEKYDDCCLDLIGAGRCLSAEKQPEKGSMWVTRMKQQ
jgi:hypothetical protein